MSHDMAGNDVLNPGACQTLSHYANFETSCNLVTKK